MPIGKDNTVNKAGNNEVVEAKFGAKITKAKSKNFQLFA